VDYSKFKTGDLVRYKTTDKESGKTLMKYGVVLYLCRRYYYYGINKGKKFQQLVIGVLQPNTQHNHYHDINDKFVWNDPFTNLRIYKRFLWKNETVEKVYASENLTENEKIFLSLTQDMVLNWKKYIYELKYYHEV